VLAVNAAWLVSFNASGFNVVAGVAVPKALVVFVRFNGDGTLTGGPSTASINGVITRVPGVIPEPTQ
jgi:hypothetical protein